MIEPDVGTIDGAPADLTAASKRPSAAGKWLTKYVPAVLIFVSGLVLWEVAVRALNITQFLLPKPTQIATTFGEEFSTVMSAGWFTLKEAVGGLIIGSVLAISVAFATARWRLVREGAMPFAIAMNSMPIVALAPISNAWFGITDPLSKMAVVAVIVFFPVMINTTRGLTQVHADELELMRSYASNERQVLARVRVPNALPFVFSALKVASALSVIGAIVTEYFGGPGDALGVYISNQAGLSNFPEAWAAIIVGSAMGVGLYTIIVIAEHLFMPWHVSLRTTE